MNSKHKRHWWEIPMMCLDIVVLGACTYFGLKYAYQHGMLLQALWSFIPTVTILLIVLIKDKVTHRWGE